MKKQGEIVTVKSEIIDKLSSLNIFYEICEHKAVLNMDDSSGVELLYPEANAKNLFVCDDKKKNYYLLVVKNDKRVDLKDFRLRFGTRRLSFASVDELKSMTGLISGCVTPFGLLNDEKRLIKLYIDKVFLDDDGLIGVHPNENTSTIFLKTADLIEIIKGHGNSVEIIKL